MSVDADNLIWIDLEMTGLDTMSDQIIEIATIVTNQNLEELAVGPVVAIYQDCLLYTSPSPRDATLSRMPSSA